MANNLMQMLADVPPMLIAGWTAWFIAGGMLAMWYRRASLEAEFAPAAAPRPAAPRPRPAARPASDTSAPAVAPLEPSAFGNSPVAAAPPPAAPRDKRPAPIVAGDPYGDLATLLDQPTPPRTPGDSPILNSAGSPIRPQH
jgi:hypothetical protein